MFLNVIQLAESLGVEEDVVEGWVRKEGLPCVRDAGRLLFDRAQVAAWAAERGFAAKAGFLAPARGSAGSGLRLESLLRTGGIWRDVAPDSVVNIIERIVTTLPGTTPAVCQILRERVRAPGGINWAPVGGGLALPHLRAHVALGRDSGLLAILFLAGGLPLAEVPSDGVPVTRLFFFIAPSPRAHLELLGQLSTALTRGELRRLVLEAATDAELFSALGSTGTGASESAGKEVGR